MRKAPRRGLALPVIADFNMAFPKIYPISFELVVFVL